MILAAAVTRAMVFITVFMLLYLAKFVTKAKFHYSTSLQVIINDFEIKKILDIRVTGYKPHIKCKSHRCGIFVFNGFVIDLWLIGGGSK